MSNFHLISFRTFCFTSHLSYNVAFHGRRGMLEECTPEVFQCSCQETPGANSSARHLLLISFIMFEIPRKKGHLGSTSPTVFCHFGSTQDRLSNEIPKVACALYWGAEGGTWEWRAFKITACVRGDSHHSCFSYWGGYWAFMSFYCLRCLWLIQSMNRDRWLGWWHPKLWERRMPLTLIQ